MFEVLSLKNTALSFFKVVILTTITIITLGFLSPVFAEEQQNDDDYKGNLWDTLRFSFQLEDQYKRPEVQTQVNWLMNHKSYLNQLSEHSEPYLYYILQEIQKRHMPGELALLPMIESTYNPFAYSSSGAAGLWQFTSRTGSGRGLTQNWWFDGRRDIYKSTNAALNYLEYLHHFFKGNWMLAIAAYHSGEGTVQRAVKYNGNHKESTNFWALHLPGDNRSYVPKLLALARLIQSEKAVSSKLPYISNTPYFTKVDVGTQIDLSNAAHLAGISYPEFLKLNPGNNRWTTAPKGPHTIVLPLDKVDLFVSNLNKIPVKQRSNLLVKHNVNFDFDPDLELIPEPVDLSSIKELKPVKTPVRKTPPATTAKKTSATTKTTTQTVSKTTKIPANWHKVLHVVQKNDSFNRLTQKYQVTEADIRKWNHLTSKDHLAPGQKLTIWSSNNLHWANQSHLSESKGSLEYYKIRSGDTLFSIGRKYHVSVDKILRWNPKLKAGYLVPGKQVAIYT